MSKALIRGINMKTFCKIALFLSAIGLIAPSFGDNLPVTLGSVAAGPQATAQLSLAPLVRGQAYRVQCSLMDSNVENMPVTFGILGASSLQTFYLNGQVVQQEPTFLPESYISKYQTSSIIGGQATALTFTNDLPAKSRLDPLSSVGSC